jgi:hypothetical protein
MRSSGRGIACVLVRDADESILRSYLLNHPFMLDYIAQAKPEYHADYIDNGDVWIPFIDGVKYNAGGDNALAYTLAVPALTAVTVTVEYVMLANSWGSVTHYVELM